MDHEIPLMNFTGVEKEHIKQSWQKTVLQQKSNGINLMISSKACKKNSSTAKIKQKKSHCSTVNQQPKKKKFENII